LLSVAGPRHPSKLRPAAQLKQLAELHQAGIVTDEEFAAKKAALMERF
jgi:hypothetical protein